MIVELTSGAQHPMTRFIQNSHCHPTPDEIAADEAAAREDAELAELEDAEAMPPA